MSHKALPQKLQIQKDSRAASQPIDYMRRHCYPCHHGAFPSAPLETIDSIACRVVTMGCNRSRPFRSAPRWSHFKCNSLQPNSRANSTAISLQLKPQTGESTRISAILMDTSKDGRKSYKGLYKDLESPARLYQVYIGLIKPNKVLSCPIIWP